MPEYTNKKDIPSGNEIREPAREVLAIFRGTGWPISKIREILQEADYLLTMEPVHDAQPKYKLKLEADSE